MDADEAASEAGRLLARTRWGVTEADKRERRRADLIDELVALAEADRAEQRVRTESLETR